MIIGVIIYLCTAYNVHKKEGVETSVIVVYCLEKESKARQYLS